MRLNWDPIPNTINQIRAKGLSKHVYIVFWVLKEGVKKWRINIDDGILMNSTTREVLYYSTEERAIQVCESLEDTKFSMVEK